MDNETMAMLLSGYEDYNLKSQDQKIYETIRLLNVQLGRGYYKTLPLIMSGSPGAAAQYEMGLYKTKESKKLKDDTKALLPEELIQALALLEAHRAAATSREGIKQQAGKGGGSTSKSYLRGKGYLG